tara:strand:- start:1539 stop:1961 length:423 start_codon:yes stop_codon:yes gene_type:complete
MSVIYDENVGEGIIEEYGDNEYIDFKDEFETKSYLSLCIEKPLDTIISEKTSIVIYDNRTDCYEYSNLSESEKKKYINYLHIKKKKGVPITLKRVLTEMMNNYFYSINNKEIYEYLNHVFLEEIYQSKKDSIYFDLFLGS